MSDAAPGEAWAALADEHNTRRGCEGQVSVVVVDDAFGLPPPAETLSQSRLRDSLTSAVLVVTPETHTSDTGKKKNRAETGPKSFDGALGDSRGDARGDLRNDLRCELGSLLKRGADRPRQLDKSGADS